MFITYSLNLEGMFRVLDDLRSATLGCAGSDAGTPAWLAGWSCSPIADRSCSADMSSAAGKDAVSRSAGSAG